MHLVCLWDSRAKWAGTLWHGGARPGQEGAGGRRGADSGRPTLGEGGSSSVDYCTTTVTVLDQVWRHKTELYCALLPRTQVPLLAVLCPVASDPGPPPCCTAIPRYLYYSTVLLCTAGLPPPLPTRSRRSWMPRLTCCARSSGKWQGSWTRHRRGWPACRASGTRGPGCWQSMCKCSQGNCRRLKRYAGRQTGREVGRQVGRQTGMTLQSYGRAGGRQVVEAGVVCTGMSLLLPLPPLAALISVTPTYPLLLTAYGISLLIIGI